MQILTVFNPIKNKVSIDDYTNLDRWIKAKMQLLIKESKTYYETFKVFSLMKSVNRFIDDLSNWYVRRKQKKILEI